MPRVKRGTKRRKRRAKILKLAKGYWGTKRNCYRIAHEAVEKGLQYAYRDRRNRKREFRRLWVVRINAAARENDLSYSEFMTGLNRAGVAVDRKNLAHLAITDPSSFSQLAKVAQQALSA
ncbi:MAG: 50S ribosomal protein L20 [Acidobacteriota bacterium]